MAKQKRKPKYRELQAIRESPADWEALERRIRNLFRQEIYSPLFREIIREAKSMARASGGLLEAIAKGRIQAGGDGAFSGSFNARISKELRALGAKFDARTATFRMAPEDVPVDLRIAMAAGRAEFRRLIERAIKRLSKISPEEIAGKLNAAPALDRALAKTDRAFHESIEGVAVSPKLTAEQRARIADEWQNNLRLSIQGFAKEQASELREKMQGLVYGGQRWGASQKMISDAYGVAESKARFLARQETSLLMAKFKEVRYRSAGIEEYKWVCVQGSPAHPVRPEHKKLGDLSKRGIVFKWSDPPLKTPSGSKNAGEDFNCRCVAVPVVRFKTGDK